MKNSIIYALEKARQAAEKAGTSLPPLTDALDENLHVFPALLSVLLDQRYSAEFAFGIAVLHVG